MLYDEWSVVSSPMVHNAVAVNLHKQFDGILVTVTRQAICLNCFNALLISYTADVDLLKQFTYTIYVSIPLKAM